MDAGKLERLLEEMTLEEKIGQMLQLLPVFFGTGGEITGPMQELGIGEDAIGKAGSVLGVTCAGDMKKLQKVYMEGGEKRIPLLFMLDVIHGFRTVFPIPLAMGCTFEPGFFCEMAQISGKEAAVSGIQVTFSPMADLVRDPRWGRVMESTGEDGWLNGLYAAAMVKGYQENPEEKYRISACLKHFAAYGAVEGGREYNTVDISDWMLREYYLPAYQACVEAGCDMAMTSFNTLGGVPATGNSYLLTDILREEWGYEGVIISDWGAVGELIAHGVAEDGEEAALLARRAGVDVEMMTANYPMYIKKLVESGDISMEIINSSVRRILELKNKRGLFENPYGAADEKEAERICLCGEHREAAEKMAEKSMVLLKNNGVLPLGRTQKIALIGPFGKEKKILGGWRALGQEKDTVSLYEGLAEWMPATQLFYAKGCDINGSGLLEESRIRQVMEEADVILLAVGEDQDMSGEAQCRSLIRLPGAQKELIALAHQTGKPVAAVLFNGRPLAVADWLEQTDALLEAWFPGTEGGHALAALLLGDKNPSGRLTMSFPQNEGQIPVYYNHFITGRPRPEGELVPFVSSYADIPNEPLFPFGYGLSYTGFAYRNRRLDRDVLHGDQGVNVSVTVQNTGDREGTEVVQLYLQDVKGCVVRPVRELKGFKKIVLAPGEERIISFHLTEKMLYFYNAVGKRITQPGRYRIYVGKDSAEKNYLEMEYRK